MPYSPQHLQRLLEQGRYEEVFDQLLPEVSDKLSTRKNVLSGWRNYAYWLSEAGESLVNFEAPHIKYVDWLKAQGVAPATLNSRLSQIRRLYALLLDLHLVRENPFLVARGENNRVHERRAVYSSEEVQRLLAHADAEERLLVLLATEAGLSGTEVRRLKYSDVLEGGNYLQIWRVRYRKNEFPAVQLVDCSRDLQDALLKWFELSGSAPLFGSVPPGHLFQVEGSVLREDQLLAKLYQLCQKANVAYKPWRALKHVAGVERLRNLQGRRQVQQDLGVQRLEPLAKLAGAEDGRRARWRKRE